MIVLVPTLALFVILLLVSEDSRRVKADARLAAGLHTAVALYADRVSRARADAGRLSAEPDLSTALGTDRRASLQAFAARAATTPGVTGVQVADSSGYVVASGGNGDAVAFAQVGLKRSDEPAGALRASTTTSRAYADQVRRLTGRDLVLSRGETPLQATVTPPNARLAPEEISDLTVDGSEVRGHQVTLDPVDEESLLLLGPREEGGFLAIGRPTAIVLVGFLVLGIGFAYWLSHALTRMHHQIAEQAMTDPLTGLRNRRRMAEALADEVERALRFGHPL